jgi:hypothetical protein
MARPTDEGAPMQQKPAGHAEGAAGKSITITVVNEDDGNEYSFHGGHGEPLKNIVDHLYVALKTERKDDDRLRCESNGEDVFGYADSGITIGSYFDEGHCPEHTWLFAAGTGGA